MNECCNEGYVLYHGPGQELPGCIHIPAESSRPLSDCLCWTSWFSHPAECRGPDEGFYDSSRPQKRKKPEEYKLNNQFLYRNAVLGGESETVVPARSSLPSLSKTRSTPIAQWSSKQTEKKRFVFFVLGDNHWF